MKRTGETLVGALTLANEMGLKGHKFKGYVVGCGNVIEMDFVDEIVERPLPLKTFGEANGSPDKPTAPPERKPWQRPVDEYPA